MTTFIRNCRVTVAWFLLRFAVVLGLGSLLYAHQQPMTLVVLEAKPNELEMNLHIPLCELELAFGHDVTDNPGLTIREWGPDLRRYLLEHIHALTAVNQPWRVQVNNMSVRRSEQKQSGPFEEVTVALALTPPPGGNLRDLVLHYDVVMHQVVTHKALVSLRGDWSTGRVEPSEIGYIAVNTGTGQIEPLVLHVGSGNWWQGFRRMVALGAEHIREGTDHLLFLIVLLLPATLIANHHRWQGFGGTHYSLMRLGKIVTAFTLGHSLTLLAGSLHWLRVPQQPVEVLIACSILVTAVHAIRPIFPGREAQVAAAFGLVHGLAFATVLADMNLSGSQMALSILGFNLGIEFTQLFVIAVTLPWLVLLSMTPAHRVVRIGGAVFALVAAVGWIVNRTSGGLDNIDKLMTRGTAFAPLGILFLAGIAMSAYCYTMLANRKLETQTDGGQRA